MFDQHADQEEIFREVAMPVVENCIQGYNGTIFAYGQTGSGKTYSMSGGESWESRGIIPRTFSLLFQQIERQKLAAPKSVEHNLYVSYFEIYNENGYDLLDRKHAEIPFEKWSKISLFEDLNQNLHLRNLSVHLCKSEQTAIDLLMVGNYIRRVSSTPMNHLSSRSHCIFTIQIEIKNKDTNSIRSSKLHLVDLAGSERTHKTEHDTIIKNEAKYINRSLSYLE